MSKMFIILSCLVIKIFESMGQNLPTETMPTPFTGTLAGAVEVFRFGSNLFYFTGLVYLQYGCGLFIRFVYSRLKEWNRSYGRASFKVQKRMKDTE